MHRIGQTQKCHIYRLCSSKTVEERVLQRAEKKLYLDKMVNRGSTAESTALEKLTTAELLATLKFGADAVFSDDAG